MKRLFKAFKKLKPGEKPLKDSEFPADYSSVHAGQDDEHQAHSTSGRYHSKPLVWLRPHEMTGNGTALLFEVGDVNVGSGFNANVRGQSANYCLLLCLARIGNRQDLLHSVIPPGQTLHGKNYDGSVRFIFRQFGQEFELTIDDRLPTINGELAFSGTHRGQFWLCLLEKAFAKLFGSYEDVPTCASLELLPLLTGGVCEEIYVREIKVDDLLKILQSALKRELIVEAFCARNESSDDAEKCMKKLPDLPPGGHYIISGTAQVPRDGSSIDVVKILDYRRALLDQEYTRLSSDWYQLQANATEGETTIELSDFVRMFESVQILHLARNLDCGVTGSEWTGKKVYGAWTMNQGPDEFYHDDRFSFTVSGASANPDGSAYVIISLEEGERRHLYPDGSEFAKKIIEIYPGKLPEGEPLMRFTGTELERQFVSRASLRPGDYVVIPRIETLIEGNRVEFLLRVFT